MLSLIALGAVALGLAQQTDTTFTVRPGGTVSVENFGGTVTVRTWDRNQMRVRGTHSSRTEVEIDVSGSTVSIEVGARYGPGQAELELTVPRNFGVNAEGVNTAMDVDGVQGDVVLETVNGPITVRNVRGRVNVETVQGAVLVERVTGRVKAGSANQGVRISGVTGDLDVEALNGSIILTGIDSRAVNAETVNGGIQYEGSVHDNGRYSLATHNGRIVMAIPERSGARVSVYTYNGRLNTSFQADIGESRGRGRYNFTIGSGGAEIELESFSGAIQLVRPGEIRSRTDNPRNQ